MSTGYIIVLVVLVCISILGWIGYARSLKEKEEEEDVKPPKPTDKDLIMVEIEKLLPLGSKFKYSGVELTVNKYSQLNYPSFYVSGLYCRYKDAGGILQTTDFTYCSELFAIYNILKAQAYKSDILDRSGAIFKKD